jgi:hypothetical protein
MSQINPYTSNLLQALLFRTFAPAAQPPLTPAPTSVIANNAIAPDTFTPTAQKPINNVLVIDDFTTDFDPGPGEFNHGNQVEAALLNRNPNLNITRVNSTSDGNILDGVRTATDDLVAAARAGQPLPDAINISIYSFGDDADTVAIRENLRTLARAGVKVGIIAGKEVGPDGRPQLGGTPRQNNLAPFGEPGVLIADATGERIPGATHTGVGTETSFGLPDALGQLSTQTATTGLPPTATTGTPTLGTPPTGGFNQLLQQLRSSLLARLQQLFVAPQAQVGAQNAVAPY